MNLYGANFIDYINRFQLQCKKFMYIIYNKTLDLNYAKSNLEIETVITYCRKKM